MDKERILEAFRMMSNSQGFYGRLLESIDDEFLELLVEQEFKDILELILFIEGGI